MPYTDDVLQQLEIEGDILDRLQHFAEHSPDRTLYIELLDGVNESARLTAEQLRDGASAVAVSLTERGIKPGDVALLIATAPSEFLVGLFGCMWAGVIAAPIAFPRRAEHLESRLEPVRANAGAVAVVAGNPQGDAERTVLDLLTLGELPIISTSARRASVAPVVEREIAYLQYTSGSTSDPRGVIVTHDNLMANLSCGWELLGYTNDAVNVSWCPLTHDMGLILGALPSPVFGFPSILMPPTAFIRRPMAWLRAVDRYRGTHGYSPNFGYDLLVDRSTPQERQALDLSCARNFVNGAEPVRRMTQDRFLEAFAVSKWPSTALSPGYGLAESSVLVSVSTVDREGLVIPVDAAALEQDRIELRSDGDQGVRDLMGDGVPAVSYDIRIVDPSTQEELPADQVGELWIRGASVSPGYWRRPEETAYAFGASMVGDDGGPYLRTGDLAFMHEGEIVICGRAKDLIVVRGRNLYPQDIELAAEQAHPAVRLGGSAAFAIEDEAGTALVVVAEVDGEPDTTTVTDAVRSAVFNEFEVRVADVMLVGPQGVPKTSSGKKQRKATHQLWIKAREADPAVRPSPSP